VMRITRRISAHAELANDVCSEE